MNKFYSFVKNEANENELRIEGVIASESWYEDEISPKTFRDELAKQSGDITVRINSPGGDSFAGIAIYNALNDHKGNVTVKVDGIAASAASYIAMAGDKIIMLPGSMMMVHEPWTFAAGNQNDLQEVIQMLKATNDSMVSLYVARTGLPEAQIRDLLKAETWMTAEDAVELGFADEAQGAKTSLADAMSKMKDMKSSVKSAVMQPVMSMVQAMEEAEEKSDDTDATEKPTEVVHEESETSEPNPGRDEEKEGEKPTETETEVVVETTVEENKSTAKETPMSTNQEIAKDEVVTPKATVTPSAKPSVVLKSYLKSDEAMNAFAEILAANPGDMGGSSASSVRSAWKEHLEVKAGVTNPEIFLPTPLITAIQNAFEDGGEIWNRVSKVGADVWNAAWDTEDDVNDNNGRARGYRRSEAEEKAEQVLTFASRILRPQFVYKYITLNKEDIKEQRSTGALVTYVLAELPQRIVREVERAIVIGDGRSSGDDYKIQEGTPRGFFPILADAIAGNFFADVVDVEGDEAAAEVVALAADEIRTSGEVVLIAKKGYATRARFAKDSNGDYLFPIGTRAQDILGVNTIIEPDWFNDTNVPAYDGIVVVLSGYKVVGDTTIEGFQNFILKTNKQEYLQEIWAGGGLSQRKAAIAIPTAES